MITLWDLIEPVAKRLRPSVPQPMPPREAARVAVTQRSPRPASVRTRPPAAAPERADAPTMTDRYEAVTREMLAKYDVRVRKWRTSMSGVAWYVTYRDGRVQRLIESPRPKGPMSAAVFLHEIGHHAIGFNVYKPRCLEEYHAWRWALEQMEASGLNITDAVRRRMHNSLNYAVEKAQRRGIKAIPEELQAYLHRLPRRKVE